MQWLIYLLCLEYQFGSEPMFFQYISRQTAHQGIQTAIKDLFILYQTINGDDILPLYRVITINNNKSLMSAGVVHGDVGVFRVHWGFLSPNCLLVLLIEIKSHFASDIRQADIRTYTTLFCFKSITREPNLYHTFISRKPNSWFFIIHQKHENNNEKKDI